MTRLKKLFTNWRVVLLIVCLLTALYFISPRPWVTGVSIRSIDRNSSAASAGIPPPTSETKPMDRERIVAVNNRPIKNVNDFDEQTKNLEVNRTISVKTTKNNYLITINENGLGLHVTNAPMTNIRTGLDLQGGTRVLLQPEKKLNQDDLQTLIASMKQRLNVYGLSDLTVRDAADLSGNQFIIVEIAGVSEEEVRGLLAKQGKFEAKIGNETVFVGGKDITFVCRSAQCSGLDPTAGCGQTPTGQVACRFRFSITLTQEAAQKQASVTNTLQVLPATAGQPSYLSKPIDLYLDDQIVDSLQIGAELKGKPAMEISISGSGTGATQSAASEDALKQMNRLQTVLITGSLPVKLDIIKTDTISSSLGEKFAKNAVLISVLSIIAVIVILMIAYRKLLLAIPISLAMIFEIALTLGVASFIGWNIDLAAVAGIIAAVGTGVDDQIVITDETLRNQKGRSWKDRMKSAFFIIMGAYLTVVVAMVPLIFAGAGLLKGFAITTIIGVSVGVFITRPAYAAFVETFFEN